MTDYNSGDWYGWNGGECPVHPDTVVEGIYINPEDGGVDSRSPVTDKASEFDWERIERFLLVAFRVVKEYREPREVWVMEYTKDSWMSCSRDYSGAVLFREVIE